MYYLWYKIVTMAEQDPKSNVVHHKFDGREDRYQFEAAEGRLAEVKQFPTWRRFDNTTDHTRLFGFEPFKDAFVIWESIARTSKINSLYFAHFNQRSLACTDPHEQTQSFAIAHAAGIIVPVRSNLGRNPDIILGKLNETASYVSLLPGSTVTVGRCEEGELVPVNGFDMTHAKIAVQAQLELRSVGFDIVQPAQY